MISLQKISDSIPESSESVKHYFNQATKPDPVAYDFFVRYVYAGFAIAASSLNVVGYGVTLASCILTSIFYRDFQGADCRQNAKNIFSSLYFSVAMTAYVALSIIPKLGQSLKIPMRPYEVRDEATALVLKSSQPIHFEIEQQKLEIKGKEYTLFFNSEGFGPISDSNHLLGFLLSRPDYVLIYSENDKAYLVPRDQPQIKDGVIKGTLTLHALEPVEVAVVQPEEPSSMADSILLSSIEPEKSAPVEKEKEEEVQQPPAAALHLPPQPSSKSALLDLSRIVGSNHIHKEMKYRHICAHLVRSVIQGEGAALYIQVERAPASVLKTKCVELYTILTDSSKFTDIRVQHRSFILTLREAASLCKEAGACQNWIDFLAEQRFTKIKLYGYQQKLVESVTGPFEPLSLENFWEQFNANYEHVKNIPTDEGLPKVVEMFQNLQGHFNYKDFLLDSNVPYIYGQLKKEGKVVTVLRHGTPIAHYEPFGVIRRWIWGRAGNVVPEVTSDYSAFIDAAHRKGQKILSLVLENWDTKVHGDESGRVEARLALASKPNFFPLALRFDGDFVEPKTYIPRSIEEIKPEFSQQMFGKETGFHVPGKLKQTHFTPQKFAQFMNYVQETFFKDRERLETVEEFQAFVTLTYAEAALSLCDALDVTYLEAHCKDDIDRGGAMKAIIVLLHLYKTGKFGEGKEQELQEALKNLMVNIFSAPLIVKKKPILKKRAQFIKNVIDVMKNVTKERRVPALHYAGNFNVVSEPIQELLPIGSTCRTKEEYQDFVNAIQGQPFSFAYKQDQTIESLTEVIENLFNNEPLKLKCVLDKDRIGEEKNTHFFNVIGNEGKMAQIRATMGDPLTLEFVPPANGQLGV